VSQKTSSTVLHEGLKQGKETFHCGMKGKIKLRKELWESIAEKQTFPFGELALEIAMPCNISLGCPRTESNVTEEVTRCWNCTGL